MKVMMANGERMPCPGVYPATTFTIEGKSFSTDFFTLPQAGYDVVLGTQWLASLGFWCSHHVFLAQRSSGLLEGDCKSI